MLHLRYVHDSNAYLLFIPKLKENQPLINRVSICLRACYFTFQPDGKTILLGTQMGELKEYNLITGQVNKKKITLSSCFHPVVCLNTLWFFFSFSLGRSFISLQSWQSDFHVPMLEGETIFNLKFDLPVQKPWLLYCALVFAFCFYLFFLFFKSFFVIWIEVCRLKV